MTAPDPPVRPAVTIEGEVVVCDARRLGWDDLEAVNTLAALVLAARRVNRPVQVRDASPQLRALIDLAGLAGVVRCEPGSGVEVRGEAEQRKEALGVEEEGDP